MDGSTIPREIQIQIPQCTSPHFGTRLSVRPLPSAPRQARPPGLGASAACVGTASLRRPVRSATCRRFPPPRRTATGHLRFVPPSEWRDWKGQATQAERSSGLSYRVCPLFDAGPPGHARFDEGLAVHHPTGRRVMRMASSVGIPGSHFKVGSVYHARWCAYFDGRKNRHRDVVRRTVTQDS